MKRGLRTILYNTLGSYDEIAGKLVNPKAARAVGANGSLTGFAYGLAIKEKLIALEQG